MTAWLLTAGCVLMQTARNEKMRIRSNVNLGALLEAQGGYHAAFDAAFSVSGPPPITVCWFQYHADSILAASCAQPRSMLYLHVHKTLPQSAHAQTQGCMHDHKCSNTM